MEIKLYQKNGTYKKKDTGEEKPYTNFYVKVGNTLVPINVPYFPNDNLDGRDPNYNGRIEVLKAAAEILPEKNESEKPRINPYKVVCPKCGKFLSLDDKDDEDFYLICDKECGISAFLNRKTGDLKFTDPDGNEIPF